MNIKSTGFIFEKKEIFFASTLHFSMFLLLGCLTSVNFVCFLLIFCLKLECQYLFIMTFKSLDCISNLVLLFPASLNLARHLFSRHFVSFVFEILFLFLKYVVAFNVNCKRCRQPPIGIFCSPFFSLPFDHGFVLLR